jgi:hypothetical protein
MEKIFDIFINTNFNKNKKTSVIVNCILSLVFLTCLSVVSDSSAYGAIEVVRNITIQNATDPGLAINQDSNKIYAVFHRANNGSSNLYMISSDNNGSSYTSPVRVNDEEEHADPNVSPPIRFGPNNEVFVLWHTLLPGESIPWGIPDIRLAKSIDGGETFDPTINPAKNESISERGWADLAISNNGTILIPYVDNELVALNESTLVYHTDKIDYLTQINIMRSADGGETFQKITLDNEGCQCCDTATTLGPDGEIYFAYRDSDRGDAKLNDYSNNYIRNYSESIDPSQAEALKQGLIETKIYSTTRDIVISHTLDNGSGLKYSSPVPVQDLEWVMNGCPSVGAGFKFDPEGAMHVGYFTGNGTDGAGYYYLNSSDNGLTFGDPVPIYTADYVPTTHTGIDLIVDKNNDIWMAFVTYPTTENDKEANHGENTKILNVVLLDKSGNKMGQAAFSSKDVSNPSLIPVLDGAMVGFSDGNENFNMITLEKT